jgi:hypothetical protein
MSNPNTPFGFRPVGTIGSHTYNGKVETFYVSAATAIGIGDPVALSGGLHTDGTPIAVRATSTSKIVGVMLGVRPLYGGDLSVTWRKASTAMYILVETDPNTIYEVQEDSDSGYIALADGTKDVNFVLGTVDTTTGNGKTQIDSSSVTTSSGAALDCLLIRPVQSPDNAFPGNYTKWLVKFNLMQYGPGASLAGV